MAQDFEQLLKDVFGEPLSKLSQFQSDQLGKLTSRLQEIAREAVKDELTKLHGDVAELRSRLATLERERAQHAADSLEQSF
jgi:predicted nuclease with TOPRIM domain